MVRTHTVVAGETLSALALRFYGDAELYRLIASASGIADPDVIIGWSWVTEEPGYDEMIALAPLSIMPLMSLFSCWASDWALVVSSLMPRFFASVAIVHAS